MSKKPSVAEKGKLSIHTENIFPIIKQFLYADQEVFLRELVSNAVDATQKLRKLATLGEYTEDLGTLRVTVKVNPTAKTITISDSGVGMDKEEISNYINQIAFSGATEFVEKYKQAGDKEIIGHFGLGFYSAFMVAEKVEIHTLSYRKGAKPVLWTCTGNTDFEIGKTVKKERGTDIVLRISEDSKAFLEENRIKQLLKKYCQFLPVDIAFEEEIINQTDPPWTKSPNSVDEKAYKDFYKRLYPMAPEPLFWIHLHVDYPFELTGILYFPPIAQNIGVEQHKIQLYSRQVFITEELKDVVPQYLQLLHGVLDSPDIPLNVSRSALQSDARVKKIHTHITKKVADRLATLFKEDRAAFEQKWQDIGLFVKYGMCSEEAFHTIAEKYALLENTEGKLFTLEEYRKEVAAEQLDKKKQLVLLYTTDKEAQHGLIEQARRRGYDVLKMDGPVDAHFVNHMESKHTDVQWRRLDADSMDALIDKGTTRKSNLDKTQEELVSKLFEGILKEEQGVAMPVKVESLSADDAPVSVMIPEFMRRMQAMSQQNGTSKAFPDTFELRVNANHPLVQQIAQIEEEKVQRLLADHDT